MAEKTLGRVNKKEFHKSRQSIDLTLIISDQIVVSDKFKPKDDGFKYFIGYRKVKLLNQCVLPYLKGVDTSNTLKKEEITCLF